MVKPLTLYEHAPIPEVSVHLGQEVDRATVRIEVVQIYPGRLSRIWAICLTVIFVAAAAAQVIVEVTK